jgi:hypothetical protein
MRRLAILFTGCALLLPGAARSAACSPLNCGSSQVVLSHGTLLAYRAASHAPVSVADLRSGESLFSLPWGFVYGKVLVHQEGNRIEWYDATTGKRTAVARLPWKIRLAGASQDGSRAVAFRAKTLVELVTPTSVREVQLPKGNWDFDALRGNHLVLIQLRSGGYQVRLVDLARRSARTTKLLKDPHESGTIWGQAWSRLSSPDGRYVFTLYLASNGAAMVHELDLATAKARCIDLPGTGDYGSGTSWGMVLAPDGRTLWLASPGYGRVVGIDIRTCRILDAFRISLSYWNLGNPTRTAVSPDGTQLALTDGETVARIDVHLRRVVGRTPAAHAVAVGYSPDTGDLRTLR